MEKIGEEFFNCDCVELAQKILGKYLCVRHENMVFKKIIMETETYGINDSACHARKGMTKRNAPMFGAGGTVYVYLCYGLHEIVNISAGAVGEGQGVMIRGIEGATGPGRVTKLLYIDRIFNNEFMPTSNIIWLEQRIEVAKDKIQRLKRIGIGYAEQVDQDRLWRFRLDTSSFESKSVNAKPN